jgi:glycerol uptake facilitator-like aquaporin
MHIPFRLAARAEGAELLRAEFVQDRFRHDRTCRIACAQEEHVERPSAGFRIRRFHFFALPYLEARNFVSEAQGHRPHGWRRRDDRINLMPTFAQRTFCEWLGTAFLLAAVVGSGIMAQRLAGGNGALALLCNTLPTGAILVVLILVFGPLSGAHFNPAVSIAFALRGALTWQEAAMYMLVQIAGGIAGVWAAHVMFELPMWQLSTTGRTGSGQWLAEAVATFGLVVTIFGCVARAPASVSYAVGLYITSAYWFTASTSFANPAVTVARALSDTYAGIAPAGAPGFIAAQLIGMLAAVALCAWLWPQDGSAEAGDQAAAN